MKIFVEKEIIVIVTHPFTIMPLVFRFFSVKALVGTFNKK